MSASQSNELRFPVLRALGALVTCAVLSASTSGCFVITDSGGSDPPYPSDDPDQVSIDSDATMFVSAGEGAGLFVEYLSGGGWNVYTSCDTALTNNPCAFDVVVTVDPGVTLEAPELHDAEPVDTLELVEAGFHLTTGTALGLDGVTFTTDPGAAITVDMLLDGSARPEYIFWVSDGVTVSGGSDTSNPLTFVPTFP